MYLVVHEMKKLHWYGNFICHIIIAGVQVSTDELAAALGHEIAHVVLRHSVEKMTNSDLWDMSFTTLFLHAVVWTLGPMNFVTFLQMFSAANWMNKLGLELPFSRLCEEEADFLGSLNFKNLEFLAMWKRLGV
jgi:Zn-dependent protease with chaperone function